MPLPPPKDSDKKAIVKRIRKDNLGAMTSPAPIPYYFQNRTFVAFDTETTGLWAATHRIVELAGVKFRLGEEGAEEFQSLVNPGRPIPNEVIAVHGITDELVVSAPPIEVVLQQFADFCGDKAILIAHNAPFDLSFVNWELTRTGISFPDYTVLDSVLVAREAFPDLSSYSLLSLARELELADRQEHRALDDARLVRQLIREAALELGTMPRGRTLPKTFRTTVRSHAIQEVVVPESFQVLSDICGSGRLIEIEYAKPDQTPQRRAVRPHMIHQLGSALYLNAFCTLVDDERTFRLDRIRSYRPLND